MNDRLREQLIGYALGALDDHEQREVEQQLSSDPSLRRQLEQVQNELEPLADACDEQDPPAGLAERACTYVSEEVERLNLVQPGRRALTGGYDSRHRLALADWFVVSGICATAVLLFFPAILNSRFMSRVTLCQNNLRQIGTALVQYSDYIGKGFFPKVPTHGNQAFAGIYASRLCDAGLLNDVRCFVCPNSDLAERISEFRVPTLCEIDAARGTHILILQRFGGGSYGYNLGVIVDKRHNPIRNRGRATFALMADAPLNSWNPSVHGDGRNILFEDQHIAFVADSPSVRMADDPFSNRWGRIEAGVDAEDAVVASSDCPPIRNVSLIAE